MGEVKCAKCSKIIWKIDEFPLVSAHGNSIDPCRPREKGICESEQPGAGTGQVYSLGDVMPEWVMDVVNESGWLSGRLTCSCGSSVGRFDYVNQRYCLCGSNLLPPVSVNVRKVDIILPGKATAID